MNIVTSFIFATPTYEVLGKRRASNARYAKGVKTGDEIALTLTHEGTRGASSGGNYALYFAMFLNGEKRCLLSQNEVQKLLDVFDLIEK